MGCTFDGNWTNERLINAQSFTEAKSENVIDRIKGVAEHPQKSGYHLVHNLTFKVTIRQLENDDTEQAVEDCLIRAKAVNLTVLVAVVPVVTAKLNL